MGLRLTFYVLRLAFYALLLLMVLIPACGGGIKLVDLSRSSAALNLSEEQQEIIHPKIAHIQDIVEDYKFEKEELEADYLRYRNHEGLTRTSPYERGGPDEAVRRERNEMRTKVRNFVIQRRADMKAIASLIDEIKANLTPEQLVLFETLKPPELELPDLLKRRPYENLEVIPGPRRFGGPDDFFP